MQDHLVGVIADTHGLVRPEAIQALAGCERIVHAGDVGSLEVLEALRAIGPVTAVRGNVDRSGWAGQLPRTAVVEVGGSLLYVLHEISTLDLDPAAAGFAAVISGHTHRPLVTTRRGVLYLNPGSAGPRRFAVPPSVALLRAGGEELTARIVEL